MQTPRFTVPAPDKVVNPGVLTDPTSARDWIAQLPFADLVGVTHALSHALFLLNRHPQKLATRTEVMTLFRAPCARLIRVAPGQANAPSSDDLRQLTTEMGYGYKHLVNEALSQRSWLQHRKKLLTATYFATKFLSLELFLAFEAYDCKISNSWREILTLYRLAEQQNLVDEQTEDRDQSDPVNATIGHVAKRVLLLKLMDPCHMQPGEARACFDYLNVRASDARIGILDGVLNPAGRFLLDLQGAVPPCPLDSPPADRDRYRLLNLVPASKRVRQELRQMELQGAPPPPALRRHRDLDATQLLRRMLRSWHGRQERQSQREETFGWLLCGTGLSAVHFRLERIYRGSADTHRKESGAETQGKAVTIGQPFTQLDAPTHYPRIRCRQFNRSLGGVGIRIRLPSDPQPRVGQIVLLEEDRPDTVGDWYAGVVRRCLRLDVETMELGIQFIRGMIHPIGLRPLDAPGPAEYPQAALWINRGSEKTNSLMVARGLYRYGREYMIEGGEPAPIVAAGQVLETNSGFERFRYRAIEKAERD